MNLTQALAVALHGPIKTNAQIGEQMIYNTLGQRELDNSTIKINARCFGQIKTIAKRSVISEETDSDKRAAIFKQLIEKWHVRTVIDAANYDQLVFPATKESGMLKGSFVNTRAPHASEKKADPNCRGAVSIGYTLGGVVSKAVSVMKWAGTEALVGCGNTGELEQLYLKLKAENSKKTVPAEVHDMTSEMFKDVNLDTHGLSIAEKVSLRTCLEAILKAHIVVETPVVES